MTEPNEHKPEESSSASQATPAPVKAPAAAAAPAQAPAPESAAAPTPAPVPARPRSAVGVLALVLALIALGIAGFAAYWSFERTRSIEESAARRLQAADRANQDLSAQLRAAQDLLRELQGRTALMEAKLAEAASQQVQLDRLLQEFSRNRNDRILAEVEQAVLTAARQLQWNGNVRGALSSLQDADDMLERINQPASLGLRRLIAADIDRINALNTAEPEMWIRRLDTMLAQVEGLPLVSDAAPAAAGAEQRSSQAGAAAGTGGSADAAAGAGGSTDAAAAAGEQSWLREWQQAGRAWLGRVADGLAGLVRVNRVDKPDALLLSPEQGFYARENLRLNLASARLALLARDEDWLDSDLERAMRLLQTYFDESSPAVKSMLGQLRQLVQTSLDTSVPSLSDTLVAVRSARARGEPR